MSLDCICQHVLGISGIKNRLDGNENYKIDIPYYPK